MAVVPPLVVVVGLLFRFVLVAPMLVTADYQRRSSMPEFPRWVLWKGGWVGLLEEATDPQQNLPNFQFLGGGGSGGGSNAPESNT